MDGWRRAANRRKSIQPLAKSQSRRVVRVMAPKDGLTTNQRKRALHVYHTCGNGVTAQTLPKLIGELGLCLPQNYEPEKVFPGDSGTDLNKRIMLPERFLMFIGEVVSASSERGKEDDRHRVDAFEALADAETGEVTEERLRSVLGPLGSETVKAFTPAGTDLAQFEQFFSHDVKDPFFAEAFKRLGAQTTDSDEFVLDTDALRKRCEGIGMEPGVVEQVVNLFDSDASGEVEFEEFYDVLVNGAGATGETLKALKGLWKLIGAVSKDVVTNREASKVSIRHQSIHHDSSGAPGPGAEEGLLLRMMNTESTEDDVSDMSNTKLLHKMESRINDMASEFDVAPRRPVLRRQSMSTAQGVPIPPISSSVVIPELVSESRLALRTPTRPVGFQSHCAERAASRQCYCVRESQSRQKELRTPSTLLVLGSDFQPTEVNPFSPRISPAVLPPVSREGTPRLFSDEASARANQSVREMCTKILGTTASLPSFPLSSRRPAPPPKLPSLPTSRATTRSPRQRAVKERKFAKPKVTEYALTARSPYEAQVVPPAKFIGFNPTRASMHRMISGS